MYNGGERITLDSATLLGVGIAILLVLLHKIFSVPP